MKLTGSFFILGVAFVLPIVFLEESWELTGYFAIAALTCLVVPSNRFAPKQLSTVGFAVISISCLLAYFAPAIPMLAGAGIGIGSSLANLALLQQAAATGPARKLLQLQAFMAVGNATPPLLAVVGVEVTLFVVFMSVVAAAMTLFTVRSPTQWASARGASRASLSLAVCSGLATAAQLGVLIAAQQLVDDAVNGAGVWAGASIGIVLGRVLSAVFSQYLSWRVAGAFALAYAALILMFPLVGGGIGASVLAFLVSVCIGPVFPLVLAAAYSGSREGGRIRGNSGPLALAISIGTSGVLPFLLGADSGRWATVALAVTATALAGLLFRVAARVETLSTSPEPEVTR